MKTKFLILPVVALAVTVLLSGCASMKKWPVPWAKASAADKIIVPPESDHQSVIKLGRIPPQKLSKLGRPQP